MKQTIAIWLLLFITTTANCQTSSSDSFPKSGNAEKNLDKFANRCFNSFKANNAIDSLEKMLNIKLCNISSCMTILEVELPNFNWLELIYSRLEELASKFFGEGTPVLIVPSDSGSVEKSEQLNENGNVYGITYISLGNSCIRVGEQYEGVEIFNAKTKTLVKFVEPVNEKRKKRE